MVDPDQQSINERIIAIPGYGSWGASWTFHTPWSGQITGSPGNYIATIPLAFRRSGLGSNCEYTGTLTMGLTAGSSAVSNPSGVFTRTPGPSPLCFPTIILSGPGGVMNRNLIISGSS